jgi:RES domain-containing protein
MKGTRTDRVLFAYRIGDPRGAYPIYDSEGARLYPGRWNTEYSPIIYAAEHYSTAMLEKLVHGNNVIPPNQHYIKITIPNGTAYEVFQPEVYPGWDNKDEGICKTFGETWYSQQRSAILIVPSIPARIERNILINPQHPASKAIECALPEPVWWDERLYG